MVSSSTDPASVRQQRNACVLPSTGCLLLSHLAPHAGSILHLRNLALIGAPMDPDLHASAGAGSGGDPSPTWAPALIQMPPDPWSAGVWQSVLLVRAVGHASRPLCCQVQSHSCMLHICHPALLSAWSNCTHCVPSLLATSILCMCAPGSHSKECVAHRICTCCLPRELYATQTYFALAACSCGAGECGHCTAQLQSVAGPAACAVQHADSRQPPCTLARGRG